MDDKVFVLVLEDSNDLYLNICVKIKAKDILEVEEKLKTINIERLLEIDFPDKDYDYNVISINDLNTMTELM